MKRIAKNWTNPYTPKQRIHLPKAGGSEKKLGMGIEPILLAMSTERDCGDSSLKGVFLVASFSFFLFADILAQLEVYS